MVELFKSISTPIIWVLTFLILGLIFTKGLRKKPGLRVGWYFLVLAACILFFLSIKPVSNLLVYSLECQYRTPPREVLEKVEIMVVLGGGVKFSGGFRKNPEASGATYSRVFNGVKVFRQSGARVLVLSGAGENLEGETNAEVMMNLAIALSIPEDTVITECTSRNTMEHAIELAKLFPPKRNVRIGIVTSALHIPRAVQAFRKIFPKDVILPVPVSYIYSPPKYSLESLIPHIDAFSTSSYAIHEWFGRVWYLLRY